MATVMLSILICTIPHKDQRYPTCGDWMWDGETLKIFVSLLNNWKYEALVAAHELVEALYCKASGVNEEDVNNFDLQYEKNRPDGDNSEPGDDVHAPYYKQHKAATLIEKFLAFSLGVNWVEYEKTINSLY